MWDKHTSPKQGPLKLSFALSPPVSPSVRGHCSGSLEFPFQEIMNLADFLTNSLPDHELTGKALTNLMKTLGTGYVCILNFIFFNDV